MIEKIPILEFFERLEDHLGDIGVCLERQPREAALVMTDVGPEENVHLFRHEIAIATNDFLEMSPQKGRHHNLLFLGSFGYHMLRELHRSGTPLTVEQIVDVMLGESQGQRTYSNHFFSQMFYLRQENTMEVNRTPGLVRVVGEIVPLSLPPAPEYLHRSPYEIDNFEGLSVAINPGEGTS